VFKITPNGNLATLHSFDNTHGANPTAALVEGGNGSFYGTTINGAANNFGTIFNITSLGSFITRHVFDETDGESPNAGLVRAIDGNFWGTTETGGTGFGTIYKVTPSGTLTTLHRFSGMDGSNPLAGLIQASDGDFYGVTSQGGTAAGSAIGPGTIFKIGPQGALVTLHIFDTTGGYFPTGTLVQGSDGNLYGTTEYGGAPGLGTIFVITPAGAFTKLHEFAGTEGAFPVGGLAQATNGNFYGTTLNGGNGGFGTVFLFSAGLAPIVKTLPVSGKVGAPVTILGTQLIGASAVTFNGTPASFTVNRTGTAITTTVPAGASTGTVQVSIPAHTLSSYPVFTVNP
jgi:uncharacterized repeat protein (TIGR03803 family)